jgi:asparagine synthase (glutamine-hydrolysing)
MSGFYGIYRYDQAPVDPSWLERMKQAMAYYGEEGGRSQAEGALGMGHLLRKLNPEDSFENQPMRGNRGLVVCTARLDNRDELLEAFGISAAEMSKTPDGCLVSLAFDRWGEEICSHLQGDWALAAWDANARQLYLARDVFGMAALYYYEGKGFIAFASSMKALLAIPGIDRKPDRLRLAEVLVGWHFDAELTAYEGFRSVVGGRLLNIAQDGHLRSRAFWVYGDREPIRYGRDEEYVEAFLEHYTRAVKSCLRSQKPVAAELSGGRDSGSVVTLAAPILAGRERELSAFTSVPWLPPEGAGSSRIGDEWEYAHQTALMAGANVRHYPVDAREYSVLAGIEYFLDVHDGPGHGACNQYWVRAVMDACSQSGAGIVLTGRLGNATVSWSGNGNALLALLQGFPGTALRLLLHAEANPWLQFKRQVLKPLVTPGRRLLRRYRHPFRSSWQSYSALNREMAKRLRLDDRMRASGYDPTFTPSPWEDLRSYFFRPEMGNSYGTSASPLSDMNAWHSLTCVDPTVNLKLFEFLQRVPDDQFYRRGESSLLIRRAFSGRMPEPVLQGKRKGLQAADVGHRIVREQGEFQQCLLSLESLPEAREMLDLPLLQRSFKELLASVNLETTTNAMTILTRGLGVGLFLRRLAESG